MSWKLFKVNMLLYMNNPIGVVTPQQFGIKLVTEYDACMRRGGQLIGKEAVLAGNIGLMTTLMNVATANALTAQIPEKHAFLKDIGNAVKGYWTGATLQPFPIYPIPAPGSIQNIILNSGMVTNPGTWPQVPFEIPTKSCLTFIEAFVMFAKIHLFTLQGMFMTTSLYPSAPSPIPAPGVANWVGYMIPDIPMFGLSLNQNNGSETGLTYDNSNSDGPLSIDVKPIEDKPKPVFTSNAEKNARAGKFPQDNLGDDALSNQDDKINEQLRNSLSNSDGGVGGRLDDKLNKILEAEQQKDAAGLDRFYSRAIKSIGDFKNTLPDTDEQFRKSLSDLQFELQMDKDNCCVNCD